MQNIIPVFLPTQPADVPYKGAPHGIHDLIMQQVQFEDRGIEGFVRDQSHMQPEAMAREVMVNRKDPIARNWSRANITRFAYSLIA